MADADKIVEIQIRADARNATQATSETVKGLQDLKDTTKGVSSATAETTEAVKEGTEKFSESRRETREAVGELGRFIGVNELGTAAMGKTGAAIFAMGVALEHLKSTYEEIKDTINGPLKIDVPPEAPAHISAAATAWNEYATARAAVIAESQSPEGIESAEEKRLGRELQLIKQVLAAEREKALADLELRKEQLSPDEYRASRDNISLIFDSADKDAERRNRQQLLADKTQEAANLEIAAQNKLREAQAIHVAPPNVAEVNQKFLDDNAAEAAKTQKEIKERLELIERQKRAWEDADVPEYEGLSGAIQRKEEENHFLNRYGDMGFESAETLEKTRLSQAQAEITRAANYRANQERAKTKTELETEAGKELGKSENLRGEIQSDTGFNQRQDAADAYIASLHRQTTASMLSGSAQTAEAVRATTAAVVGGFRDVHQQLVTQQEQINELRAMFQTLRAQSIHASGNGITNF